MGDETTNNRPPTPLRAVSHPSDPGQRLVRVGVYLGDELHVFDGPDFDEVSLERAGAVLWRAGKVVGVVSSKALAWVFVAGEGAPEGM